MLDVSPQSVLGEDFPFPDTQSIGNHKYNEDWKIVSKLLLFFFFFQCLFPRSHLLPEQPIKSGRLHPDFGSVN